NAGEPAFPVRPSRAPRTPDARQRVGGGRPFRVRRHPGAAPVGRPEAAAGTGPHLAVAGTGVAARRALREPGPGGHHAGEPDDFRPPAQRWRGAGHDPWRLRRPAGTHAAAATAGGGMIAPGSEPGLWRTASAMAARD